MSIEDFTVGSLVERLREFEMSMELKLISSSSDNIGINHRLTFNSLRFLGDKKIMLISQDRQLPIYDTGNMYLGAFYWSLKNYISQHNPDIVNKFKVFHGDIDGSLSSSRLVVDKEPQRQLIAIKPDSKYYMKNIFDTVVLEFG